VFGRLCRLPITILIVQTHACNQNGRDVTADTSVEENCTEGEEQPA
jgi:hypothetical protein